MCSNFQKKRLINTSPLTSFSTSRKYFHYGLIESKTAQFRQNGYFDVSIHDKDNEEPGGTKRTFKTQNSKIINIQLQHKMTTKRPKNS